MPGRKRSRLRGAGGRLGRGRLKASVLDYLCEHHAEAAAPRPCHRRSARAAASGRAGRARDPRGAAKAVPRGLPYDAAAIDAALDRRVDPERDLKQDLDLLRYEIRRAVKEPARLFREIYAQLRTPGKGYSARIGGLLVDPGAYGGLRGRKGSFVPAAEQEERERAERAYAASGGPPWSSRARIRGPATERDRRRSAIGGASRSRFRRRWPSRPSRNWRSR